MTDSPPYADVHVVLVTAPDTETAEKLVRTVIDERLAVCGTIVPGGISIYRWQGEVQRESEVVVLLKAHEDTLARLIRRVPELHPYDVPEVLALPVVGGHRPYLDWIRGAGQ